MTLLSNRPLLALMASIFSMLAITACQQDEVESFDFDTPADHTLLMYMVGDYSNMSGPLETNVVSAQQAIRDSVSAGRLNLVVFMDNQYTGHNLPVLYWVHGNMKHELDTVMIRQWDTEIDASSPDVISDVVKTTFQRFDTSIKGLVLASHASGWVPKMNNACSPRRDSFGLDQDNEDNRRHTCELTDLSDALLRGPHLDYLILDCCYMGNAEVAYEMRDVARYMTASPTEVMGSGLPYVNVVTRLAQCRSVSDLPDALDYGIHCYFDRNKRSNGATIALYDLQGISQLATCYRQYVQSSADRRLAVSNSSSAEIDKWQQQFQAYGREVSGVHYKYYFYDILDVATWLSDSQTEARNFSNQLSKVVLKEYHTDKFLTLPISRCSGMGVTIPEVLLLAKDTNYRSYFASSPYSTLTAAYHQAAWGAYLGY